MGNSFLGCCTKQQADRQHEYNLKQPLDLLPDDLKSSNREQLS